MFFFTKRIEHGKKPTTIQFENWNLFGKQFNEFDVEQRKHPIHCIEKEKERKQTKLKWPSAIFVYTVNSLFLFIQTQPGKAKD